MTWASPIARQFDGLGRVRWLKFPGHLSDDPLRVVQAMPGVAGGDDFRSEYSVRGSPYRHAGPVVDGVAAPWLQHAALGRGNTGTLTMLRGDMVCFSLAACRGLSASGQ